MTGSDNPILYAGRRVLAATVRLLRLIAFGLEQLVLLRLFKRIKPIAGAITMALVETKSVRLHPPVLCVTKDRHEVASWSRGFSAVNAALFLNLRGGDARSPLRYAQPAPAFRAIYLWDSAFIAQVWRWWDVDTALEVLCAVLRARDGARLQHFVSEFGRSPLTQPPLAAWSLERIALTSREMAQEVLAEAYAALKDYHAWLREHRRLPDGLYAWAHAYESGVENAPRFGDRRERRLRETRRTAAPDFCTYVVLQCEALASIGRALGRHADADAYLEEAAQLRAQVNDALWDDAEGLYFDRDPYGAGTSRARTIASLLPLWGGIPDETKAQRLIEHILDPGAFNTLIPLPSVALDDPAFERDMWRGPVWINTAFAVIEGLRRYGRHDEASDFAYRICDGVYRTFERTGRLYEFYDPTAYGVKQLHRKRGNRWKAITLGAKPVVDFVGWTGLVNTMVIEVLFGISIREGRLAMRPRFPKRAVGRVFSLSLPLWDLTAELAVVPGRAVEGEVRCGDASRKVRAEFGEAVALGDLRVGQAVTA